MIKTKSKKLRFKEICNYLKSLVHRRYCSEESLVGLLTQEDGCLVEVQREPLLDYHILIEIHEGRGYADVYYTKGVNGIFITEVDCSNE